MRSNGKEAWATALGTAVRAQRKALGLTQIELADLSGVGPAFLYGLEQGKPTVRLDKVMDVMESLGLEFQIRFGQGRLVVAETLRGAAQTDSERGAG